MALYIYIYIYINVDIVRYVRTGEVHMFTSSSQEMNDIMQSMKFDIGS